MRTSVVHARHHYRGDWRNSVRSGRTSPRGRRRRGPGDRGTAAPPPLRVLSGSFAWRGSGAAGVRGNVDELDLRSKDRESDFLFGLEVCKSGLLYVLAFFGIIAVGCLSGLPSATCFALDDAYTVALYLMGGLASVMTVLVYLAISTAEQWIKRGKLSCHLGLYLASPVALWVA
jgi:hypothetical protein